jgi:hypothetical protein
MTKKISFMWSTHIFVLGNFLKDGGITMTKTRILACLLPSRLQQLLILFLDCCRFYSTATPSLQYIVIVANFFTHPLDKRGYKVNINLDVAVPMPVCFGTVSPVFGPPLLPSMSLSLFFFVVPSRPLFDKSALNGSQKLYPETTYYGFVAA